MGQPLGLLARTIYRRCHCCRRLRAHLHRPNAIIIFIAPATGPSTTIVPPLARIDECSFVTDKTRKVFKSLYSNDDDKLSAQTSRPHRPPGRAGVARRAGYLQVFQAASSSSSPSSSIPASSSSHQNLYKNIYNKKR
ncbi:hypothetical protein PS1_000071 [Malus domestica]